VGPNPSSHTRGRFTLFEKKEDKYLAFRDDDVVREGQLRARLGAFEHPRGAHDDDIARRHKRLQPLED
jgi:hypothetical protein